MKVVIESDGEIVIACSRTSVNRRPTHSGETAANASKCRSS